MKKAIIIFVVMILISIGLVACGSAEHSSSVNNANVTEDGNKYLKVWVPSEELEFTREMCDLFLEEYGYDSLTIECLAMSSGDALTSLEMDWTTAADIIQYSTGDGRDLVAQGLLLPIGLNYDALKDKYDAKAFESASFDGFLYGIPFSPSTWVMYYNKEIFTEEDVKSIEAMLNKDTGLQYNFSCAISSSWYIEAFYYAKGCTLFGEDGKQEGQCSWNDADGYQVSKYLMELANNLAYYEDMNGYAYDYFLEGQLGAFCGAAGSAAGLKAVLGDDLGVVKLPAANISGEEVQLRNFIEYSVYGVKANTQYPKEAQELAIWLGSEECQMARYEQFGVFPTMPELYRNETILGDIEANALLNQMEYCVVVPQIRSMKYYWDSATAFGEGLVQGTIAEDNLQHYLDVLVENITIDFIAD